MWEKVKLRDITNTSSGGTPSRTKSEYFKDGDIPWILSGDLNKNEIIESKHYITDLGLKNSSAKIFPKNSILIAMYGATIGNASILRIEAATNQAICCIFPNPKYNSKFLYYYFKKAQNELIQLGMGNAQPNISQSIINEIEIPLPPLPIQEKIADILDKADKLRRKDKDLQSKYDELAQAIFIDMFGDPVRNEKGWELKKLSELGYLKNGLNYGNNESGKELTVFGVGDFKSNWLFDDYSKLKTLNLDTIPNKNFLLADGDILFVRSNGNKELIGRAILLKNINSAITYSGFCIKFTRTSLAINEYYLIRLLVNSKFKKYILNGGRGANIQNINQEILSTLKIPVPPIAIQEKFAKKIELVNQLKAQTNAEKSEELFQSLLQKAFKGELVS
ncbi:restriction endonuclease subunit S [Sphingobacterium faecium]|uniref:restriction endonuclease subunit S n=1 Tax=Sphingobacterium faecium TaxID=34087 RepID=UPI00247A755B|nr:restriction endonuclease subunit S [Sphingobacterium faecium]WGQ15450.1 restriction endonuclease subunit S [Sphingobacterium faecium]